MGLKKNVGNVRQ